MGHTHTHTRDGGSGCFCRMHFPISLIGLQNRSRRIHSFRSLSGKLNLVFHYATESFASEKEAFFARAREGLIFITTAGAEAIYHLVHCRSEGVRIVFISLV